MGPSLVKLVLLAEMHEQLARGLEGQLQVDEVGDELTRCVEDDVLGEHLRYLHRLWFGLTV